MGYVKRSDATRREGIIQTPLGKTTDRIVRAAELPMDVVPPSAFSLGGRLCEGTCLEGVSEEGFNHVFRQIIRIEIGSHLHLPRNRSSAEAKVLSSNSPQRYWI